MESVMSNTRSLTGPTAEQNIFISVVDARSSPTLMWMRLRQRRASKRSHWSGEANHEEGSTVRSKGIHSRSSATESMTSGVNVDMAAGGRSSH